MSKAITSTGRLATAVLFVAVTALAFDVGVRRTQAIQDSEDFPSPIGIARGQTLRITALNIGERAIVGPEYRLLDGTGHALASTPEPHLIPPGEFRSFDFAMPDPPPGILDHFGRIQVRVFVGTRIERNLRLSLEVFDNDSGKTTLLVGDDISTGRNAAASPRE